ncbi:hypothetical protein BG004_003730 [Podila humilis]|nr:hypothetical protein BG004_003730 [Podila humilis]
MDILISGAGPTGLFAAILLTKLGHRCRIIERHFEISPLSKALVIHARTMEQFDMTGILDKFTSQGHRLTDIHAYFGGKLTSVLPVLRSQESAHGYGLFLEQLQTTSILTTELERLGGHVDRGWELMDTKVVKKSKAEEDGHGNDNANDDDDNDEGEYVETVIRRAIQGDNTRKTESNILGVVDVDKDEAGKEYEVQTVRSRYLIATDGGKSAVRHKLEIPFLGRTLDNNIILVDCLVDTPIPLKDITVLGAADNHQFMACFPVRDDIIRIILDNGTLPPEEHSKLDSNTLTLEMCQKLVDECVGPKVQFQLRDPSWLTYYRVNERLAEKFAYKNRIFLAGDAAHVHSPAGGQGMNTGLQDSYNLAWKMSLVLDGLAPESILETYESERKPVAANIISLSARGLEFGLAQDFWKKLLRRIALTVGPYIIPLVNDFTPPIVSMLGIRYYENALNIRHETQSVPDESYSVGHRARDGELHVVTKDTTTTTCSIVRLHDLTVAPGIFHILVFAADMLATNRKKTVSIFKGIETTHPEDLAANVRTHLENWRTKWSRKGGSHVTESTNNTIVGAIPSAGGGENVFMIHVIASDLGDPVAAIAPEGSARAFVENGAGNGKLFLDPKGVVHGKYGVAKHGAGALIVVRPDSHLGYRVLGAGASAWADVDVYWNSILKDLPNDKR